ncbi:MAG: hypothetical protein ACRD2K_04960 [Terriglobales bacterium]
MKEVLRELAAQLGLECRTSLKEPAPSCEWLLDVVWWQKDHGAMLGVESEWGPAEKVIEDFAKLLSFKAPLKLMVYCADHSQEEGDVVFMALQGMMTLFGQHVEGEEYVLLDFSRHGRRAYSCKVPTSGRPSAAFRAIPLGPEKAS